MVIYLAADRPQSLLIFVKTGGQNEFLDEPQEYTLKPLLPDNPQLFILKAFTKLYAMPGLRLGFGLCTNAALLTKMEACAQPWRKKI